MNMHAGLPCRRGGETKAGRDIGYYHMEKLTSLDRLPYNGFMVSCFPAKIENGPAGWPRAVAILND